MLVKIDPDRLQVSLADQEWRSGRFHADVTATCGIGRRPRSDLRAGAGLDSPRKQPRRWSQRPLTRT